MKSLPVLAPDHSHELWRADLGDTLIYSAVDVSSHEHDYCEFYALLIAWLIWFNELLVASQFSERQQHLTVHVIIILIIINEKSMRRSTRHLPNGRHRRWYPVHFCGAFSRRTVQNQLASVITRSPAGIWPVECIASHNVVSHKFCFSSRRPHVITISYSYCVCGDI